MTHSSAVHLLRLRVALLPAAAALALALAAPEPWAGAQSTVAPLAQAASAQAASPAADGPEAGPNVDYGPIVIEKKKESEEPPPPPAPAEPQIKNPGNAVYALHVNVPIVNLDVSVFLDKNRQFVPGLKAANFLVLEDGVEQTVEDVRVVQTPITAVMLLEFAANSRYDIDDMRNAATGFFKVLRPDDYVAVMTYDLQTHILCDFTNDKDVVAESLNSLTVPSFSDTDMFDALYQTLDRVSGIDGRKYIVLVGTGRDTFSKITLDKILEKIRATPDVTIFSIGTGALLNEMGPASGMREMDYLQAQNQMRSFAEMTGGLSFFPIFPGELPADFAEIDSSVRNQYLITYRPTNAANDGSYRKLKVILVDNEGQPLEMQDEKGRPLKYSVVTRDGYRARLPVQ